MERARTTTRYDEEEQPSALLHRSGRVLAHTRAQRRTRILLVNLQRHNVMVSCRLRTTSITLITALTTATELEPDGDCDSHMLGVIVVRAGGG